MLQNVSSKKSQFLKNGLFSDCWGAVLSPRGTFLPSKMLAFSRLRNEHVARVFWVLGALSPPF